MTILVVEDDANQHEWIRVSLRRMLKGASSDIIVIETESEAMQYIDEAGKGVVPDLCIVDIMLAARYDGDNRGGGPGNDEPQASMVPQVGLGGFYDAGLRVLRRMANTRSMRKVPVLVFTVIESSKAEPAVKSIAKEYVYLDKLNGEDVFLRTVRTLLKIR